MLTVFDAFLAISEDLSLIFFQGSMHSSCLTLTRSPPWAILKSVSVRLTDLDYRSDCRKVSQCHLKLSGLLRATLTQFVERSTITGYSLRNSEYKLAIHLPLTMASFRYSGALLWNSFSTQLQQAISPGSFPRWLRWLLLAFLLDLSQLWWKVVYSIYL